MVVRVAQPSKKHLEKKNRVLRQRSARSYAAGIAAGAAAVEEAN